MHYFYCIEWYKYGKLVGKTSSITRESFVSPNLALDYISKASNAKLGREHGCDDEKRIVVSFNPV